MTANCPNCGAPIVGKVCGYCGTHHAQEAEQVRIEVKSDFVDVRSWDGAVVCRVRVSEHAGFTSL